MFAFVLSRIHPSVSLTLLVTAAYATYLYLPSRRSAGITILHKCPCSQNRTILHRASSSALSRTSGNYTGVWPLALHRCLGLIPLHLYSDRADDYTIGPPIGYGASSIVYAATFRPSNGTSSSQPTPCALKVVDLDRLPPHALHLLMQETQLMSLSKHPNVLRVRGTWMEGHKLYIALRLMNSGSAMDVMRYAWPGGMEEEVVRCILRQALQGLK